MYGYLYQYYQSGPLNLSTRTNWRLGGRRSSPSAGLTVDSRTRYHAHTGEATNTHPGAIRVHTPQPGFLPCPKIPSHVSFNALSRWQLAWHLCIVSFQASGCGTLLITISSCRIVFRLYHFSVRVLCRTTSLGVVIFFQWTGGATQVTLLTVAAR